MNLEGFEIIKDFPNYMINKKGDVYSLNRKRLLYPSQDKDGYFRVGLSKNGKVKHCRINRLIMLQFHPIDTPEKYVVNHIDGNKQNNDILLLYIPLSSPPPYPPSPSFLLNIKHF